MMVAATSRGMSIEAFSDLNPGQIVDFCLQYNAIFDPDGYNYIQEAGQKDFDRF